MPVCLKNFAHGPQRKTIRWGASSSQRTVIVKCVEHDKLLLKATECQKDCVYDDKHGTYIGCHYIKFCRKPICKFRQYYGILPDGIEIFYDDDWMGNKFFLSTKQTAFTTTFLKSFDVELLIGQLSYNQKANIYNAIYGYNRGLKKTSSSEKGKEDLVHQADSEETFSGKDNR